MTELTNLQKDLIKELGNIGMGNAAAKLGEIVNSEVSVSLPRISVISLTGIEHKNQCFSGMISNFSGDINGIMILYFSNETAFWLIDKISQNEEGTTNLFTEMGQSALKEFYNIIGGALISSIADFTKFNVLNKTPELYIGEKRFFLEKLIPIIQGSDDTLLAVKTTLKINDKILEGDIFLKFDLESFEKISKKIIG